MSEGGSGDGGDDGDGAWIDRTNMADGAIGPAAGYDLPATLTDLCLTNNRIASLDGLAGVPRLRRLGLRQNCLKVLPPLTGMPELEELDCYINEIAEVDADAFAACRRLRKLDLSFNDLRDVGKLPVETLGGLEELYLISNKIKVIRNLHAMPRLTLLELGDNRVRVLEGLDALPTLTSLWLGRNKIEVIERLHHLPCLQILSLQSNRITRIEGLAHLTTLTELYLSHNGIEVIQGIDALTGLRVLDLSGNLIEAVEGVATLVNLAEFWANDNRIENLDAVGRELSAATRLETAYLEGNPCAKGDDYMEHALRVLPPALGQLDALPVSHVRALIEKRRAAVEAGDQPAAVVDAPSG
jgi:protein phosphatase 1 regulatory subunit 7